MRIPPATLPPGLARFRGEAMRRALGLRASGAIADREHYGVQHVPVRRARRRLNLYFGGVRLHLRIQRAVRFRRHR